MALCEKPCCNAAAREAIRQAEAAAFAEKNARFEAWLAEREAKSLTLADASPLAPDPTYKEAVAHIGKPNEAALVRILTERSER
jgi:hypothetical protein